jgi:hypothetical protein
VVATLLAAFHLGLDVAAAVAVVSIDSLTTLLPILPNGAGAQQAAIAGALHTHASTTTLIAFSAGTQLLVSTINALTGAVALALLRVPWRASKPSLANAIASNRVTAGR